MASRGGQLCDALVAELALAGFSSPIVLESQRLPVIKVDDHYRVAIACATTRTEKETRQPPDRVRTVTIAITRQMVAASEDAQKQSCDALAELAEEIEDYLWSQVMSVRSGEYYWLLEATTANDTEPFAFDHAEQTGDLISVIACEYRELVD